MVRKDRETHRVWQTDQDSAHHNWAITVKHIAISERVRLDFMASFLNQADEFSVTGQGQRNYFTPSASNFNNAKLTFPEPGPHSATGTRNYPAMVFCMFTI